MKEAFVSGSFDDLCSEQVRFLEEAARTGAVKVFLWSDELARAVTGASPRFALQERMYLLEAIRYVSSVRILDLTEGAGPAGSTDLSARGRHWLPESIRSVKDGTERVWVVPQAEDKPEKAAFCRANGIGYRVISRAELAGFPCEQTRDWEAPTGRKKVIVTGCYDWLHSGHVRFFEQVSALGDLYVVVGHDANVRLLKGTGHPHFSQEERRYMVQSVRFVRQALVSSGSGWMDAEPEIGVIHPDIYAVNEDGDQPEKRIFCQEHELEYVVFQRLPRLGLPNRSSTELRGY